MGAAAAPLGDGVNSGETARSVCVFCGSRPGTDPAFREAAEALGLGLARAGLQVIFGGSSIGLMGHLADAAIAAGGHVTGVRPARMFRDEPPHAGLARMFEVDTMHERKQLMSDLADAFVVLPGGAGTLDELSEVVSWAHIRLHRKPIVVVDLGGFWSSFFDQLARAESEGFLQSVEAPLVARVDGVAAALAVLGAELGRDHGQVGVSSRQP